MSTKGTAQSSLAKKYFMALTGLFLCLFLVGHLLGNLQLLGDPASARTAFNEYALFMTTFPAVKVLSYLTYFSVIYHVVSGIRLSLQNRAARPVKYVKENGAANAIWSSRNMGILGTIILVFLATHMQNFWYTMHFDKDIPMQAVANGPALKDLYEVVTQFFNPAEHSLALLAVAFYLLAQVALAFHLYHGFESGFQSLGVNHPKYTPMIKRFGQLFSIAVPALFAVIPVYLYISQL
jgi:succinate dehydrogenase / fumarate reductase cytochrome b subunit